MELPEGAPLKAPGIFCPLELFAFLPTIFPIGRKILYGARSWIVAQGGWQNENDFYPGRYFHLETAFHYGILRPPDFRIGESRPICRDPIWGNASHAFLPRLILLRVKRGRSPRRSRERMNIRVCTKIKRQGRKALPFSLKLKSLPATGKLELVDRNILQRSVGENGHALAR